MLPTLLVTKPKHRTKQTAMKQSSSIPVKTGYSFLCFSNIFATVCHWAEVRKQESSFYPCELTVIVLGRELNTFLLFPVKLTHFSRQLLFFVVFKGGKVFSKNDSKSRRILLTIIGTFLICTTPGYPIIENFYLALRNLQVSCY